MAANETALIVGAGKGLSASLARLLEREGMNIALAARNPEKLESQGLALRCDATDPAQVEAAFDAVQGKWGVPDLVVYNASYRTRGAIAELDPAEVQKTLSISAFGGFLVAQAAAKRMLPRGAGAIFFTGASASVKGYANSAPFAMGKFALRGLAQSMARELAPKASTWRTSSSTAASERTPATPSSIPTKSRATTCTSTASSAAPGPGRSSCVPGSSVFEIHL